MTPAPRSILPSFPVAAKSGWPDYLARVVASGALVAAYYWVRDPLGEWVGGLYTRFTSEVTDPAFPRVLGMTLLLVALLAVWRKVVLREPKLHAPILITVILALSDASFKVLENHPTPSCFSKKTMPK